MNTGTATTLKPITEEESQHLIELEKTIAAGRQTFIEVGTALAEIHDKRLYKAQFETFEAYCVSKWGFKRAHAHRLIAAASVAQEMSPMGEVPSERIARELIRVPKERRAAVIKLATTNAESAGRNMTAKDISAAAQLPSTADASASNVAATEVPTGSDDGFCCPRVKTQRQMENWYFKATPRKRAGLLNFIFTTRAVEVEDKAEFKTRVDKWLEHFVTEVRTKP